MTNYNSPFDQKKARFITPPNLLKQKVGSGGLGDDILMRAQKLLEENNIDFLPLAEHYLDSLRRGLDMAYNPPENASQEYLINNMLYPTMQLKANGGMFHYPLVTRISDRMINFLETVKSADADVQEIVQAYYTTIRAILGGHLKGEGGQEGEELYAALCDACERYFEKNNT